MKRFNDKIAFISGATRGIGYAAAHRMASEGATVIISAHVEEEINDAVANR